MANAFSTTGSGVNMTPVPKTSGLMSPAYSSTGTPNFSPSTPVKSITSPSGTTTTFHSPSTGTTSGALNNDPSVVNYLSSQGKATDFNSRSGLASQYGISGYTGTAEQNTRLLNALKGGNTPSTGTTPGVLNVGNTSTSSPTSNVYGATPTPVEPGNADGSTNLKGLTGVPSTPAPTPYTVNSRLQGQLITGLANSSQQPGQAYLKAQEEANRINQQIEEAKRQFAQQTKDINTSGTWTSRALGEQGQANIQNAATLAALGSQYQGAVGQIGNANTQQGLQQSALTGAISGNAPIAYSPTQTPYSPATGTFLGDQSQIERAVTGANIGSAQELTQQANNLKSVLNGADANFRLLIDTAKQGGLNDNNVPALNTLINNAQRGLTSSSAVTNFRATLQEVRNQYANILGGGSATDMSREAANSQIPEDISLGALQALYSQMTSAANNRILGIENQVKTIGSQNSTIKSAPVTLGKSEFYQDANGTWHYK